MSSDTCLQQHANVNTTSSFIFNDKSPKYLNVKLTYLTCKIFTRSRGQVRGLGKGLSTELYILLDGNVSTTQFLIFTYVSEHSLCNWILILAKRTNFFRTARKSILKLVKLSSLVAKYCKIRKMQACKVCTFCIFFNISYCAQKSLTIPVNFSYSAGFARW